VLLKLIFCTLIIFTTVVAVFADDTSQNKLPNPIHYVGYGFDAFVRLDRSNAFNSEYDTFNWSPRKLGIMFVNPPLTEDSLKYNNRVFRDLSPGTSYWAFMTGEIAGLWWKHTDFHKVEWCTVPVKAEPEVFVYRDEAYSLFFPDSTLETFRATGFRFILLLQNFTPVIKVYGKKGATLAYERIAPEASKYENYKNSLLHYYCSYTYVLFDLLENRLVQFGKAFDENRDETAKANDIQHNLDDVIMDVIEVSRFKRKR
jgi:hypothetical protein